MQTLIPYSMLCKFYIQSRLFYTFFFLLKFYNRINKKAKVSKECNTRIEYWIEQQFSTYKHNIGLLSRPSHCTLTRVGWGVPETPETCSSQQNGAPSKDIPNLVHRHEVPHHRHPCHYKSQFSPPHSRREIPRRPHDPSRPSRRDWRQLDLPRPAGSAGSRPCGGACDSKDVGSREEAFIQV